MKRVWALLIFLPLAYACASRHSNENPSATEPVQGMQQMEARMQHMQEQMERIRGTEDAQERQRLMHEHMESMQQSMTMMRRMMGQQRGEHTMGQAPQPNPHEAAPDETERHEHR
jgi:TolA-binding protein